jgi:1,4-alpha-glucan branching enzyme
MNRPNPPPPRHPLAQPEILRDDPWLAPFAPVIRRRMRAVAALEQRLCGKDQGLAEFALGHLYFGLLREGEGWVMREWAPNATAIWLVGAFNDWREDEAYRLERIGADGVWEWRGVASAIEPGQAYRLSLRWPGGGGTRIPAYADYVVQNPLTHGFDAVVWQSDHIWQHPPLAAAPEPLLIYEAHVGMAQEEARVGSYLEFRDKILPRIAAAGYNAIQLMAVQEHPYYGSFGYQVANFFAASSRFGTPDALKALIDAAHGLGLAVIMDLVHSHAAPNALEGLACFDGTDTQYFHAPPRGIHPAWGSRCFDYAKPELLHFLLSNCRYWLDEYRFDGFRFDGVTSMLYHDHGLQRTFTRYDDYFDANVDEDALAYLCLANTLIHTVRPPAVTIAEDVSGLPGMALPVADGGLGFDYRLAMGIPDYWIKLIKERPDEAWPVGELWHALTNRRAGERHVAYAESHDQALVGDQTLIFRLIERHMYEGMSVLGDDPVVERGIALVKLIRLVTFAAGGEAYLNFMGNEFGHPEWIDFPREGNAWSYHYARRQWSLRDDPRLRYHQLAAFDRAMLALARAYPLLQSPELRLWHEHAVDQVLAFQRGPLFFLVNFHPTQSFSDYAVHLPPGDYALLLDTDAGDYGGHGRIAPGQRYFTRPAGPGQPADVHHALVYLPARTALVWRVGAESGNLPVQQELIGACSVQQPHE